MTPWFRFYHEALDDPKVQTLPAETFRNWVNMMCLACRNGGKIHETQNSVSFAFRVSPEKASEILLELHRFGLLDRDKHGFYSPHNWDYRQFKSDTSTERVKRFRKRFRNVSETANETDQTPETETDTPIVPKITSNGNGQREGGGFEIFWQAYPRKSGKGAAEKSWKNAKGKPETPALLSIIETAKRSQQWTRENGRFIPYPATWLNQRRWADDYGSPVVERKAVY